MERRGPLLVANILRFTGLMSFGPLLQFHMSDIGIPLFLISLFSSVQGTVDSFMSPVWGALSDVLPSKRVILLISVLAGGMVSIFYYFADSVYEIYIVGIIYTFFMCGFDPTAMSMSSDFSLTKGTSTSRELSFLNMTNSIGMLAGRLLLSILLLFMAPKSVFPLMSIVLLSSSIFVLKIKEKGDSKYRRKTENFLEAILPILKDPTPLKRNGMWAVYLASFLRQSGTAGAMGLAAIFIRDVVGLSESFTVILAAINPMVQIPSTYFFGKLTEKIHPKFIAIIGMLISTLNLILMGCATNYLMVMLSYVTLGFGFGAFIMGVTSYISIYSPNNRKGEMLGFLKSARSFGRITGPLIAALVSMVSFRMVFFVLAGMMVMSVPIMLKYTVSTRTIQ